MATATEYDPGMTVEAARRRYFDANGFGEDGGYAATWVVVGSFGPIPLAFPNSKARVRAVRYHDLHHLVTGYDTDMLGEAEIAAWELASGCAEMRAAWILNSLALPYGWRRAPDRVERAFARGLRSRNLYREAFDERLLATSLGELRERLGVEGVTDAPMTPAERAQWRATLWRSRLTQAAAAAALVGGLVLAGWMGWALFSMI